MSSEPFLLVAPFPRPDLVRQLSVSKRPVVQVTDYGSVRSALPRAGAQAGVVLDAGNAAAHRRAALRLLAAIRGTDAHLSVAVLVRPEDTDAIRESLALGARPLLLPTRPRDVVGFLADALRHAALRSEPAPPDAPDEALARSCHEILATYGIPTDTRAAEILRMRVRGRFAHEVCNDLGIGEGTYRRHVRTLREATGLDSIDDVLSLVLRHASRQPLPWSGGRRAKAQHP